MNIGLALNPAAFSRTSTPSQGKVNAQVCSGGGSMMARDKMVKASRRQNAMHLVGARVARHNVLDKAGVNKVAAPKKR